MTSRRSLEDAAVRAALVRASDVPVALEHALQRQILRTVAATSQRRPFFSWRAPLPTRTLALAVALVLLMAAAGALAVSTFVKPAPKPEPMQVYHHNGVIVTLGHGLNVADYPDHDQAIALNLPYFGPAPGSISWSPDGEHLLAWVGDEVQVGDIGSGAVRTFWTCDRGCQNGIYPEWSPDGKSVAIGHGSEVTLVSPAGTVVDRLVLSEHTIDGLSWAPGADQLVVAVDAPIPTSPDGDQQEAHGTGALVVVNLDDGSIRDLRAVEGDGAGIWDVDWSPDGQAIAFIAAQWRHRCCTFDFSLVAIRPDGTGRHVIVPDAGSCFCAGASPGGVAWSPDGALIAYGHAAKGLYVVRPDGTEARLVTDTPAYPAWRPVP